MPKLMKRSLPFDLRFPKRIFSSRKRFFLLVGAFFLLLLTAAFLYMLGMYFFQGEVARLLGSLTMGGGDDFRRRGMAASRRGNIRPWWFTWCWFSSPAYFLFFLIFPIYLIPFLEERFETRLPKAKLDAKDHVVIFHHGPAVATLLDELERAEIATVVIEEEENEARRLFEQGHRVVFGNLDEGVLERTSLHNARALIVNSTDDRNAATILAARQLGYKGEILALVEDPYHRQPMILAGASGAYTPRHILGAALAARASQKVSPTVAGIQQLGHKLQVTEARVMRDSVLAGKTPCRGWHRPTRRRHGNWFMGRRQASCAIAAALSSAVGQHFDSNRRAGVLTNLHGRLRRREATAPPWPASRLRRGRSRAQSCRAAERRGRRNDSGR